MPFGEAYLGQTVRLAAPERYSCTGQWYGNKGNEGQMVIYAGFGDSFPDHAYYLSMGLADPSTLRAVTTESLRHDNSLQGVLKRKPEGIRYTLAMLQNNIDGDPRSKKIYRSGRIIQQLLRS